jgi:hypothetical protein
MKEGYVSPPVTIYADDNFSGASQYLAVADYDHDMLTIGNDKLSSVKVSTGYTAILYRDFGFSGDSRLLVADAQLADLNGFNDQTSSVRVTAQVTASSMPYFGTCYIQTGSGLVFSAPGGGGQPLRADRPCVDAYETFVMVPRSPGKVALISANNQFVCAESGGGNYLIANRDDCAAWETFTLIDHGQGSISLQASNGMYVCAEGNGGREVNATRSTIGAWETFRIIPITNFNDHTGQTACAVKPRLGDSGLGGSEIFLNKNADNSISIALSDTNPPYLNDCQRWYVQFIRGNASTGGVCIILHAASGRLLSAPTDNGPCVAVTMLDRSSLWSVVSNVITNPQASGYGYRVLRPVRNLDMNLNVPWKNNPYTQWTVPRAVQVWSWSGGDANEIWIW